MRRFLNRLTPASELGGQALVLTIGGSAQFNGSNSLQQGATPLLWNGTGDFSVAFWWFSGTLPAVGQTAWIISQTTDVTTQKGWGIRMNGTSGFLNCEASDATPGTPHIARSVPSISILANRWYLVIFQVGVSIVFQSANVVDGMTGTDVTNGNGRTNGAQAPDLSAPFELGAGPSGTDSLGLTAINTAGRIDNIGFWNRLFTAAEVTAIKNVSGGIPLGVNWADISGGSLNDAAGFWNLDQYQGTGVPILSDQSQKGRMFSNVGSVVSGSERRT